MRKIAADYAYTLDKGIEPIEKPLVTIDSDGKICSLSQYEAALEIDDREIEYYKGTIVPGFVNSHCHIELSHLKGAFKEATGMSGFINQINALRESVDEDGRRRAMAAEFGSFSRKGIVAVSDISNCSESFGFKKEYQELKYSEGGQLFPVYYRTYVELFGTEKEDAEHILSNGQKIAEEATTMGLDASVTPHSCYTMSPELLTITAESGLKSGSISYHSQESQEEEDLIMKGCGALADNYRQRGLSTPPVTGKTALEYFIDRLRINHIAPKVSGRINLIHNIALSQRSIDKALEFLAEPFFTICPLSNFFIHRTLPPVGMMIANNLKICLGTDSLSSNHILDMVREMECLMKNFPELKLGQILVWASSNGALFLGKQDKLGSLSVGKTPGIVLLENLDGFKVTEKTTSRRIA